MSSKNNNIAKLKKRNFVSIIIVSFIASFLSIIFGTLLGLINIDFESLHLVVLGIIWVLNVFVSYTISYLIGLLFKIKFSFLNIIALAFSYTFSVILVILFSGSLDYLYVTSYFSIVTIIGIVYGLYKLYQSKKNSYK